MRSTTKKVLSLVCVTGAVGALVFTSPLASHAQQSVGYRAGASVVVASAPNSWREHHEFKRHGERHPRIVHAIRALNVAIKNLKAGDRDMQGYRVKALEAAETALSNARMALKADYK